MSRIYLLIVGTTLFVLLSNCGGRSRTEIDVEAEIQKNVAERLESFRQRQLEDCRAEAIEEASQRADSILIARARAARSGDAKPARPARPAVPPAKTLSDSLELHPLFKKSTPGDTTSG